MSLIWTPSGYSKMKPPLGTPLNPYDPLSRGLIGCWLLNEGAGTVVRDASGNGFHGTNSAATWTSGAFGPCMAFNGTDAFVDIPGKNMLYPLTMCCWVRLNVNNIVQVLLYLGDGVESGSATDLVCLRVNSEGTPLATAWRGSAGNSATGTTVLVPGVWYHLAAVFVHSTMREIYVNGVLEATNSNEEVIAGSKVYWSIGAWRLSAGGAQYHANALIDAPQFYNRALTPSEIASLYRDPYQMFRRPAIELWTVEEGGGNDYTETINDGIGVTDAAARVCTFNRTLTESMGTSDNMGDVSQTIRSFAESLGVSDDLSKNESKMFADAMGIVDSLSKTWTAMRTFSEALGLTDVPVSLSVVIRTVSDALGLTDSFSKHETKTLSDSIGITDQDTSVFAVIRSVQDNVGLTDDSSKNEGKAVNDNIGLTDAITKLWQAVRTIADDLGITDLMSEDFSGVAHYVQTVNDSLGLSDSLSTVQSLLRVMSDSLGMSDAVASVFVASRVVSDAMGITDGVVLGRMLDVSDTIGITDDLVRVVTFLRTMQDSEGLVDSVSRILAATRTFNENVGMTDTISYQYGAIAKAVIAFLLMKHRR